MTNKLKLRDIILFGIVIIICVTIFYYLYYKIKTQTKQINELHNLVNYQQTLIGEQSQATGALNHEIRMLKNLFNKSQNLDNINLPEKSPEEYNLDVELSDELSELSESLEDDFELADENEFNKQKTNIKIQDTFIASDEFRGEKQGWEFKLGINGSGYYKIKSKDYEKNKEDIKTLEKVEISEKDESAEEVKPQKELKSDEKNKVVEEVKSDDENKVVEEVKSDDENKPVEEVKSNEKNKVVEEIKSDDENKPVEEVKSDDENKAVEEVKPDEENKIKKVEVNSEKLKSNTVVEKDKKTAQRKKRKTENKVIEIENSKITDISDVD